MRRAPLLLLALLALVNLAAAPPKPRLDLAGDPLPEGTVARMGTVRFLTHDPHGSMPMRWRWRAPTTVVPSPDGTTVAAASDGDKGDTRVDFMDASTGKRVRRIDLAGVGGYRMHFTPDGKSLAFSGWSGIQLFDAGTGKVVRTFTIENARESALAMTADGKWLALQPQRYLKHAPVAVWDLKTGKEVASLPGLGASCKGLVFSPDGKRLLLRSFIPSHVSAGSIGFTNLSEMAVACIDVTTRKIVGQTTVGSAQSVALSPDGETIAIEAADGSVRVRHLPSGADRCTVATKASRFSFAPDGKALLTIDEGGRAALWDARKGEKIRDLEGALVNKDVEISGFSKDGRTFAALDGGWASAARVVIWNTATGKRVARPVGHDGAVTCIAYAPDGKALASGSLDRTVRWWDAATGQHLRVLAVHKGEITAVAISPDGKLVASSCKSGVTRVSTTADGKAVAEFAGPAKGARALTFSPDGKVLFLGGDSPEVLAFEVPGGKEVLRLPTGDDGAVMALGNGGTLALTANGEIRADTGTERLLVWDLIGKQPAASLPIQDQAGGGVRCDAAVFSPGGRLLASSQVAEYQGIRPSYGNATLRLWEPGSGQPLRTLAPVITKLLAFSPNGRYLASGGAGRSGHLSVGYGPGVDLWDVLTGDKVATLPVSPTCVAFSPDGRHLATGGRDHGVLIWEAPKVPPGKKAKAPSAAERDAWWPALGGVAKDAYKAIGQMADAPEHAVALLADRVPPIKPGDPDGVNRLIARLDSEEFAEREKAERALEKMGESVAHLLTKALQGDTNLELRRRVERLLKKCNEATTVSRQHHRAIVALEWIGTLAARTLLRRLADGAPGARLTIEARAALKRMER